MTFPMSPAAKRLPGCQAHIRGTLEGQEASLRKNLSLVSNAELTPHVFFFLFLRRKALQDKAMQRQTSTY
jgi:hypothetical protein